jgi:hypothetical protein
MNNISRVVASGLEGLCLSGGSHAQSGALQDSAELKRPFRDGTTKISSRLWLTPYSY